MIYRITAALCVFFGVCAGNPSAPAAEDTSGQCMIIRDKKSKAVSFVMKDEGSWRLYAEPAPGRGHPVLAGGAAGQFPVEVDNATRSYFVLERDDGSLSLAERLLPLDGGWNFRDLGGMETRDGRRTAWGKLIRADGLSDLSDADLTYLASVPLNTVVDFRNEREAEKSPDRLPSSVTRRLHLAITPGRLDAGNPKAFFARPIGDAFMEDMNRSLALDPDIQAVYREFFRQVQNEERLPLLFHCSAGKDRTGFAAALVLLSLGVDRKTVVADYMASGRYLTGKYDALMAKYPDHAALFIVKPSYLEAGLDAIEKEFGSVERYLTGVLGVDLAVMRTLFLQ